MLKAFVTYWFVKSGLLFARLFGGFGYQKVSVGKMIILAPTNKLPLILEGVAYLKAVDPRMFQRLTVEHNFVCFYRKKFTRARDHFTVTEFHLRKGEEEVAANFAKAVLVFNIIDLKLGFSLKKDPKEILTARVEIAQQYYTWLTEHSFPASLVDYARKNLEEKNRLFCRLPD